MRWPLLLVLLMLGCGETSGAPSAPGGEGGPVNVFGSDNGVGGMSGAGGGGGAGGDVPGTCANDSDLQALASGGSVRDVARDCGVFRCGGVASDAEAYQACVDACIENDVQGISTDCAACYGAIERCGLDSFCQLRCQTDTCSAMCLSCLEQAGCSAEFETCRGIEGIECAE
jgi:hypothetical protein